MGTVAEEVGDSRPANFIRTPVFGLLGDLELSHPTIRPTDTDTDHDRSEHRQCFQRHCSGIFASDLSTSFGLMSRKLQRTKKTRCMTKRLAF